ncbi:hypothetical protein ADILRU_0574 [Leifsonia rubra CMS 76R]|nr:hypothetical protein ADILRU_0574 [Leifsonia rubra CMS 76R]
MDTLGPYSAVETDGSSDPNGEIGDFPRDEVELISAQISEFASNIIPSTHSLIRL